MKPVGNIIVKAYGIKYDPDFIVDSVSYPKTKKFRFSGDLLECCQDPDDEYELIWDELENETGCTVTDFKFELTYI